MQNNKITASWTSIGTILGQPVIDSYTFYLKKYKAKKGDIIAAEAKLPTGEGKVIDVIVWGRINEIISSKFIKEIATLNGDLRKFVSKSVIRLIKEKLK